MWKQMKSETWKRLIRTQEGERTSASSSVRAPPSQDPDYPSARRGGLPRTRLETPQAGRASQSGAGPGGDPRAAPPLSWSPNCGGRNNGCAAKAHAPRAGVGVCDLNLTLARRQRRGGREGPGRRLRGREARRARVSQPYKDFKSAQPSGMWLGPGGGAGTPAPRWPSGRPAPLAGLRGEGERRGP